MAEDPGLVECFTSRHGGGVAGVHAVLPEPPLPDAAHHLQPPVRELEAIVQRREACLDLGRGDHVLGQIVPDGLDADGGIAHGWLARRYGKEDRREGQGFSVL